MTHRGPIKPPKLVGIPGWDNQMSPEEVMDSLIKAGWGDEGQDTLDQAFRIAFMESSHRPDVSVDYEHDESLGMFQIVPKHHEERIIDRFGPEFYLNLENNLLNPVENARLALDIYRHSKENFKDDDNKPHGWKRWTSDMHLRQLDDPKINTSQLSQNIKDNYKSANERLSRLKSQNKPQPTTPKKFNSAPKFKFPQRTEFN
jgi:hypothetical protein